MEGDRRAVRAVPMRERTFAIALFTFAVFLRLLAALILSESQTILPDSREYLAVADHIVGRRGIILDENNRAKRPPIYPLFLALHRALSPGGILPIQISQALLGGVACLLVLWVGRRTIGARVAAWAGVACAAYPLLIYTGPSILGESLLVVLWLLEVGILLHAERRMWLGGIAGIAGGLAVLAQPSHLLFFVAVLLFRRSRVLVPYALAIVAVLGVWTWRNYAILGRFVPVTTQSGYALYEAFGPEATGGTVGHRVSWPPREGKGEVDYDAFLRHEALRNGTPGRVVRLALEKQRRFWSVLPHAEEIRSVTAYAATLAFLPVLAFFIATLWKWRAVPAGAGWLLLPILYQAAVHTVFIGSIRYRLPVEPFLIMMACWAAASFLRPRG